MSSFFVQFIIKQLLDLVFVVSRILVIKVSISKILEHQVYLMSCAHSFTDRKLCIKGRLTGALQVTMNMVKNNTAFFKILQPALQVLKLYSANCKSI